MLCQSTLAHARTRYRTLTHPQRELMERNARWAKRINAADPTFFPRHFPGQRPEILWIGCECAALRPVRQDRLPGCLWSRCAREVHQLGLPLDTPRSEDTGRAAVTGLRYSLSTRARAHALTRSLPGSDARVPETTILGSTPGDIFVHRGIANLYTPGDDSMNAVLMIALINFKVKHIIVAVSARRCRGSDGKRAGAGLGLRRGMRVVVWAR